VRPGMAVQVIAAELLEKVSEPAMGSIAMTLKLFVSASGGLRLSLTITVMEFVVMPAATGTNHENIPFVALMTEPPGAPGPRLNIRRCAGMSASVAVKVKVSSRPLVARTFPDGPLRIGGVFVARESGFAGSDPK